ncbi:RNA polymerase factor sigma-54 [Blattabacterium cuenoti]|uniref:RNA polymerase factor sigma-54 n=1 Tax=Blattabacterium cuenoti TaxID=1653831 RepID=UPI00163D2903|nr:RNA polymerase factor sigma-54 [Blattabacterium cuenoti]
MLKQQLIQKGQHKLSPQQIKLMKLIQLSTLDFEKKVRQELEENPALELESSYEEEINNENYDLISNEENNTTNNNNHDDIDDYYNLNDDDNGIEDFHEKQKNVYENINRNNIPIVSNISFHDFLKHQLHTFRSLNNEDLFIADFILGNIDNNGYIRRKIKYISDDIFLRYGKLIKEEKIEQLLVKYIQKLDPIGVGSRNLQECLFIQLEGKKIKKSTLLAKEIIKNYFEFFTKKNYKKLQNKLKISKKELKDAIYQIKKLNPKPGKIYSENYKNITHIIPDFTICIVNEKLELSLNHRNIPEIKISSIYLDMLKSYKKSYSKKRGNNENTFLFIKNKVNSAKWFVDAIKKRQNTLLITMNAIMEYQKEYFLTGDKTKIKPMILKNISQKIGIGISTVSRVANSKYVNTPYGTFLIKSFFSEKMKNKKGEEISSIKIKKILRDSISKENKKNPLTDEKLSQILKKKGYIIARRTITKYREQMNIPVSRMRKIL